MDSTGYCKLHNTQVSEDSTCPNFEPRMIEVSIYEAAASRYRRLGEVLAYVYGKAEHYNNWDLVSKVKRLHDYKGRLEVTWRHTPTDGEKEWFAEAWEVQNEPPEHVKHSVDGSFD